MPNAHPPGFDYAWKNNNTLIIKYISDRGLMDLAVGLIKGIGLFYKENLTVIKTDNDHIEIVFS